MVEARKARDGHGILRTGVATALLAASVACQSLRIDSLDDSCRAFARNKALVDVALLGPKSSTERQNNSADVLLVSFKSALGSSFNDDPALQAYESTLRIEGLASKYVPLDSIDTLDMYGKSVQQGSNRVTSVGSGGARQLTVTYTSTWEADKAVINSIENRVKPSYVILLGDMDVIPMPRESTPVDLHHRYEKIYPRFTALTDDPYGSVSHIPDANYGGVAYYIPTMVVARMPGRDGREVAIMLENAKSRHESSNEQVMLSTMDSGFPNGIGDKVFGINYLKVLTLQYLHRIEADGGSAGVQVLLAPSYSLSINGKPGERRDEFIKDMSADGIQFYLCAGNGSANLMFGGPYNQYQSSADMMGIPELRSNPIVFDMGCYNGNIDLKFVREYNDEKVPRTLPLAFLMKGAAAYIGNTGVTGLRWPLVITPFEQYEGSIPQQLDTFHLFKMGWSMGGAFLRIKVSNEWHGSGLDIASAQQTVLYGDPTLVMNKNEHGSYHPVYASEKR